MTDWLLPARDTGRIRCRTAYAILVMIHGPGTLTGRTPVTVKVLPSGLVIDPATGGYWIVKSDGTVDAFYAPWHGSAPMRGQAVTGITGTPGGGYLMLTSDGGGQNYGTPWYGSDIGHLPAGVTATGITADPATGGYWILKSNGGVDAFAAPWYGSLAWHVPAGQSVTGITGV